MRKSLTIWQRKVSGKQRGGEGKVIRNKEKKLYCSDKLHNIGERRGRRTAKAEGSQNKRKNKQTRHKSKNLTRGTFKEPGPYIIIHGETSLPLQLVFTSVSTHSLMDWHTYMAVFKMKFNILLSPLGTSPSYPVPANVTSWGWKDAICDHLLYYSLLCRCWKRNLRHDNTKS